MNSIRSAYGLAAVIACGILLAGCSNTTAPPTAPSDESSSAADAPTAEASSPNEAQPATAGAEVQEPVGPAEPVAWDLDPDSVIIDTQGLPLDWEAVLVSASPYDESRPPGPMGIPEHIEIRFTGDDSSSTGLPEPIIYIIPVNEYREMWEGGGSESVSQRLDQIQEITYQLPSPPRESGMPVLPVEEAVGVNDLAVRTSRAAPVDSSASKNGFRFIGRFAQDANPVTNQGLRYIYQGFTNDAKHLVAGFFPVSASILPADTSEVPEDQQQSFAADPQGHIAAVAAELATLPASDWEPDRDTLDDLLGSLSIDGMAPNGLVGTSWEWTGVTYLDDERPVDDPASFVITYGTDGTVYFTSECRDNEMTYEAVGGMLGSATVAPKFDERPSCDPESRTDEFEVGVLAAQEYRVGAGGNTLDLQLPGEGPIHTFRLAE